MSGIKKILFPTDFSKGSAKAAQMAKTIAEVSGAELIVLHVVNDMKDSYLKKMPLDVAQALIKEVELATKAEMDMFIAENLPNVEVTERVAMGKTEEAIIDESEKLGVDMIVLGTHGRTGIERLRVMVGSIADKIVRSSSIPVLTVRDR